MTMATNNSSESKFDEVRSNYYNEEEHATYIDAWETDDPNEDGIVVAKVFDDSRVEYLVKGFENDPLIAGEIASVLERVKEK